MNNNNLKVAVIGAGWLGGPLVQLLHEKAYNVFSSNSKTLDVTKDKPPACDCLIYTVPPLGKNEVETFFSKVPTETKIIFISSTAVYKKESGKVDESSPINNESLLAKSELWLQAHFKKLSILRLGGLYGLKRHPVSFLAGKKNVKGANEFLHLAHLNDSINAIVNVLEKDAYGEIFNIVCDLEIKKKNYYETMAKKFGLPLPEYAEEEALDPTRISNEKSKKKLGLSYENPLDYT